jgi:hypothetical protein
VATGGKWDGRENGSNERKPCRGLRPVAAKITW